jgi:asparagine synthase (glutamine-hydrolysing)
MCGICGTLGIRPAERAESIVRRMMDVLRHRGPDDEGFLSSPPVALGIRRLSIIDLAGGHQPVWNETGTVAAILNGEIYNFLELRHELELLGHRFRTHSDTEVIVHAFEAWGRSFLNRLRGMFSLAVVKTSAGQSEAFSLLIARDRLGIKPLYFVQQPDSFLFASEVRALLATGCIESRLSVQALESYLLWGSVSEPMTLAEGINSLPPGHSLQMELREPLRVGCPQPYWSVRDEITRNRPAQARSSGSDRVVKDVRAALEDAVRSHLVADVPVGVFLSSGLDSTAIAAIASRARKGIETFTVGFQESDFDESEAARGAAQLLGTTHREVLITGAEMRGNLRAAIDAFDQPSMDGVNTFCVSRAAHAAGLKVALSGLGGDELFGGYPSFSRAALVSSMAAAGAFLPTSLRRSISAAVRAAVPSAALSKLSAAWDNGAAFPHPCNFLRLLFSPGQVSQLLEGPAQVLQSAPWWQWLADVADEARSLDEFSAVSWIEMRSYMLNTLLRDTDAMSMSQSLEIRVPFLDPCLVEQVLSLTAAEKQIAPQPKALLSAALRDLIPAELLEHPKRPFTFPWERWLRGELRDVVKKSLRDPSPALAEIFAPHAMMRIWSEFEAGRTTWSRPWSLYVLNEWSRRHLGDTSSIPFPSRPAGV